MRGFAWLARAELRAVRAQRDTGSGELEPYRCEVCPRQPVSNTRFWHVRHVDPTLRGRKYDPTRRPTSADSVFRRPGPEQVAELRRRIDEGG